MIFGRIPGHGLKPVPGSRYTLQGLARNRRIRFATLSLGEGLGVRLRAFRYYRLRAGA